MNSLNTAAIYLIQTLGSLYLLIVLLRFLLQLVRADFYNPLSQFIVRATKPLLMPLRRLIPGYGGLDFASLVLGIAIQLVMLILIILLMGYALPNILLLVSWAAIGVLALFVKIFFFALIISVILSWVAQGSYNPAVILINQLCEPILAPIRKILPALGGLDLSPIFAFIAIRLFDMLVIANLAAAAGMPGGLTLAL
ncbi:YggT family protein [Halopseudomonas pachastrellae]|uniref:YggT family protein n=1 Tax=Halopseudomonas pachastrellae TaxID=254161 RepID=A0A1S8DIH5_9GAMM|nr:YggT family protein [Halopseudomonas pachastrellae]MAB41585.1 YggT family protein [Pseudomonadales bacterium]MED5492139.1 YggT family protein [Pseudomonadota bacterium]ONM45184.1 YggT family protein [Halopseudomonas pachastrellae]SFM53089.1 YggT family protein [Halopseudomonas pachastrellae]|tara:strand:- start:1820 stop:2410 length:591 start_codon:yes stop_codon:yes gene_type:complete